MFNFQSLIKQTILRLLALAIIFCLSGMGNIVCCFTKCQIVAKETCTTQKDVSSCHKSESIDLIAENSSCCVKEESCEEPTKETSDCSASQNELDNNNQENNISGYGKDPSCKMSCCLPSDEVVDITRIPRIDSTVAVNNLHIVVSTSIAKHKTYLSWPIEKLPDQEKTYLRCCVFLI